MARVRKDCGPDVLVPSFIPLLFLAFTLFPPSSPLPPLRLLLFLGGIGCDERGKGPEEEEGEEKKRRKRRKRGKRRGRGEEEEKGRRGEGEKEKGGRNVLVLLMIKVLRSNITRSARLEI